MDFGDHVPNYVNPESRAGTVLSINIACCVVASFFAGTRLFVRIKILHSAGWDDLAAAVATVGLFLSLLLNGSVSNSFLFWFISR